MKSNSLVTTAKTLSRRFLSTLVCLVAIGFVWQGAFVAPAAQAIALDMDSQSQLIARGSNPLNAADRKAKSDLNSVGGYGTSNRLEGQVQEAKGNVQDALGQDTNGVGNQVQGRAQRDIGRTGQAIDSATDQAQDAAEGAVDSVKTFFGQ